MKPERIILYFSLVLLLIIMLTGCGQSTETIIQPVAQNEIIETATTTPVPTLLPTSTSIPSTATPTDTPISTATPLPPTKTPTATSTNTATSTVTPTDTATATLVPTETMTPVSIPIDTPTPEVIGVVYPGIPDGQGLLYVINFHADEAQFRFFDRPEEYRIPGKSVVPEGGMLELFLAPGQYRWASVIEFAGLSGEGHLEVVAGQVQGLGLAHGKIGPDDVVEGINLGPNPLSPPVPPTPTPIPTPPTPELGKTTLVLHTGGVAGEFIIENQKYIADGQQALFITLNPGSYDVVFIIESAAMGNSNLPDGWEPPTLFNRVFKFELVGDSICEFDTQYETYSCMKIP